MPNYFLSRCNKIHNGEWDGPLHQTYYPKSNRDHKTGDTSMKKSELEATIEALTKENQELREQIVKLKRSFEVGDDR